MCSYRIGSQGDSPRCDIKFVELYRVYDLFMLSDGAAHKVHVGEFAWIARYDPCKCLCQGSMGS